MIKTNLLVFIRPTILRDASKVTIETNSKYNYIREVLRENSAGGIQLMRDETSFTLPPFEEADRSGIETEADDEADSEKTGDEDGDEIGDEDGD
jgi:general secretion pathway protein D